MAMAINRNQNYGSCAMQSMGRSGAAGDTKMKETERTQETAGSGRSKSTAEYANEIAKLAPSVEFKVGNSFSTAQSGITLTVNPQLLEKMQNDPEKEKEMKELIKGVESAVNMLENTCKASGWTVVYKHSYIDENGKYRSIACLRNDFMLNMSDELREERRKNSEKLIEKTKEKAAEKKEKLEETLEEKKEAKTKAEAKTETETKAEAKAAAKTGTEEGTAEKTDGGSVLNKAEQLIKEKMAASKDGTIYLNDTDIRTIIEAARKEDAGKTTIKGQAQVGANLDLKI